MPLRPLWYLFHGIPIDTGDGGHGHDVDGSCSALYQYGYIDIKQRRLRFYNLGNNYQMISVAFT